MVLGAGGEVALADGHPVDAHLAAPELLHAPAVHRLRVDVRAHHGGADAAVGRPLALRARVDRGAHGVEQHLPAPAHALLEVLLGVAPVDGEHEVGDARLHELGEELRVLARAAVAVGVHHDVGEAQGRRLAHEGDDARVQRRLAAIVELDGAHAHVRALLEQPAVEDGVHVAALVRMLVEALGADVLVGPDLAEALGVLLRAPAAQVADRHRLQVHVDGMVGGVHVRLAALPFPAIGLVALGARGRPAEHAERRILAHRTGKCSAGCRRLVSVAGPSSRTCYHPGAVQGLKVGKYVIIEKIGSGAMGEVFRAHDHVLNRDVAVKTMAELYAADDQLVQRFRREAQSAARLNHPNIVTVFDFGEADGRFYLAMELLEGTDLKELIASHQLNDLWDKLDVMEQTAEGLAYAHQQGVVHRDLKPANLRVLPNGRVKIMDFGLARIGTSEMTRTGMVMGTPNYMSPEQVKGTKADARSDIFSLGAVFYELISGKKAFNADSMHTILYKVLEEEPEPVRNWVPGLPGPFVALVEKCLAKEPDHRYQHGAALRDALRKVREALASGDYMASEDDSPTIADAAPPDASAATVMAGGSAALPTRVSSRAATTGATALDLARATAPAPGPDTLRGAPTLNGRARTAMRREMPPPRPAPARWPVYAGAAGVVVLLAAAGLVVMRSRGGPVGAPSTPPSADAAADQQVALREALVGNQVELARADLQNKDYPSAMQRAERALALDPSSTEARQLLDQAKRTAADLDAAAAEARRTFDAGDTDGATRALARVLALDPKHPVASELSAALNVHFRKQAEDARRAV
ncbi:MAG: hypothetical protein DMF78_15870, partial [Acidobacteria bacterium]